MDSPMLSATELKKQFDKIIPQITKWAVKTKPGSLPGKPVKTNQDSYISVQNFMKYKKIHIYSVCDGHGVNGHIVSQFIKKKLPMNIEFFIKSNNLEKTFNADKIEHSLISAFQKTEKNLQETDIDIAYSGSTCVLVYVINDMLFCANLGDSRAIIVEIRDSKPTFRELSID